MSHYPSKYQEREREYFVVKYLVSKNDKMVLKEIVLFDKMKWESKCKYYKIAFDLRSWHVSHFTQHWV